MRISNTKGFTLIELVITMLISSIALLLAGSILLSSVDYFTKTTISDVDKKAVDAIASHLRDELLFTSEIKIVKKSEGEQLKDEGWHYYYVNNGRLFRNDEQVYNDDFYNRRTFSFYVRGFDSYRLDLDMSFLDGKKKDVYKTSFTLELLNLKKIKEKHEDFNAFEDSDAKVQIHKDDGYWICYKKGTIAVAESKDGDGTIVDKVSYVDITQIEDFKDQFYNSVPNKELNKYEPNDFVKVGKDIYLCTSPYNQGHMNAPPGSAEAKQHWQKIQIDYDKNSSYLKGDVIRYTYTNNSGETISKYFQSNVALNVFAPNPEVQHSNGWLEVEQKNGAWIVV